MFQLRFTPDFARQRREWLAQDEVPEAELPAAVQKSLELIVSSRGLILPGNAPGALWRALLRELRPLLFQAATFSVVSSACASFASLAAMSILKRDGALPGMVGFAVVYFALNCASQGLNFKSGRLRGWVGLSSQAVLVSLISHKLLRISALAAARQSSGNLKVLVTSDVSNVSQFLENVVRNLIPSLCALVVVSPFLLHFSGKAGFVGILVMAALLPIALLLNAVSSKLQGKGQLEMDRLATLVGEWVKNIRLIRYLSWEDAVARDVSERLRKFLSVTSIQHFTVCILFGLSVSWWMVSVTAVIWASRVQGSHLNLVSFFGSLWLLTFLAGYFTHLPNTIRLYGLAAPSMHRIAQLLSEADQADSFHPAEMPLSPALRPVKIRFEQVSFEFSGGKKALKDFTVEIDLRRKIAIIGEIGSGKTTLLRLLCGELPPTEGRILVEFEDGQVRNLWEEHAHAALRACIAYVPQNSYVSSDLFANNISLVYTPGPSAEKGSSEAKVLEAAYWAELEADLATFKGGVNQEIGESGVNLSGGQRQRLNLARARYSGREILVLDDTLSAVDTRTEVRLMERLVAHPGGLILVTHRTGEIAKVEQVIVLSEGTVVERGSPALLGADPSSHYTQVIQAYERLDCGAGGSIP